ncbi:hypothetical protein [Streptomyces sp. NPDC000851]
MLAVGKQAAAARGLDFNRYVERLIIEDTTGARAAGMAAAQRLIKEHGAFLDDFERELAAPYGQPGRVPPRDPAHRRVLNPGGRRAGRPPRPGAVDRHRRHPKKLTICSNYCLGADHDPRISWRARHSLEQEAVRPWP